MNKKQLITHMARGVPVMILALAFTLSQPINALAATAVTHAGGSDGGSAVDKRPLVNISESVAWTNEAAGEAEVTINVDETPETAEIKSKRADIIQALDRSSSMVINNQKLETAKGGFAKDTTVNSGHCPCLNDNHSYKCNGKEISVVI